LQCYPKSPLTFITSIILDDHNSQLLPVVQLYWYARIYLVFSAQSLVY
jgi:hypothetical protein